MIEALAARVSILEGMQSSVHPTNLKAHSCPVGDCDKSFRRSDHLHRHIRSSTDSEHKKKHSILLERKYCFPCQKGFNRPCDLVRHEKNAHKDFNRFEEDLGDQQLMAKNNEALEQLDENILYSPHLIGQSIEFQPPALTSGYHTVGQSGDVSTHGSGFFDVDDFHKHSQIMPSGSYYTGGQAGDTSTSGSGFFDMEDFNKHSQILPSGSYYTGGQAGDTSTSGSGFFDMEDFNKHSQILPSGSYYTGGQAGDTSTSGSGFFDMEDFNKHSQILPSGSYYTDGRIGDASTGGNGFFEMQDSRMHGLSSHGQPHFLSNSQILCTKDYLTDGQAGNAPNKGSSFLGLANLHNHLQTSRSQPYSYDPRILLNGDHCSGGQTDIMSVSHQQDYATKRLVT
ncbi:hypothetical protein MMC13_001802 [Lambiella insularis]|nr:hypothetical protein [Lambiella insularis]